MANPDESAGITGAVVQNGIKFRVVLPRATILKVYISDKICVVFYKPIFVDVACVCEMACIGKVDSEARAVVMFFAKELIEVE